MRVCFTYFIALIFPLFANAQEKITSQELKTHISFLTADSLGGRYPGTKANRQILDYIKGDFSSNGITIEIQFFQARLRRDSSRVKTSNVLGFIEGTDPNLKNEFVVLGAHYDHLGIKNDSIYHGADDNASGTAALLEIGEKLAANRKQLKRSVLLIAFGAEEQGLLGSRYFTENPPFSLNRIKLMINMDMLGRLNSKNHVYMGGAGTFPGGQKLMKNLSVEKASLGNNTNLNPVIHAGSVGGSDHVSFYLKGISVLGIHTGGHDHYHKPSDTMDLLNLEGEVKVCNYIYKTILAIAGSDREMRFIEQD
jgi:Zn-dependent M28 family amino/carboxypeptidase